MDSTSTGYKLTKKLRSDQFFSFAMYEEMSDAIAVATDDFSFLFFMAFWFMFFVVGVGALIYTTGTAAENLYKKVDKKKSK